MRSIFWGTKTLDTTILDHSPKTVLFGFRRDDVFGIWLHDSGVLRLEIGDDMNSLITEHQAAEQMALTPSTLRKWRWLGKGPNFVKIGSAVRYEPSTIKAFIDKSVHQTTKEF